jgi:hypothetical protein
LDDIAFGTDFVEKTLLFFPDGLYIILAVIVDINYALAMLNYSFSHGF